MMPADAVGCGEASGSVRGATACTFQSGSKLQATTLNTIGLTIFGLGVLTPVLTGSLQAEDVARLAISGVVAYILHVTAQLRILGL